jgi:catechol 2,3-dioxygenase-like lactoylglutathione lyase family enzyme
VIDHVGFPVSDLDRSTAFYDAALAPLGLAAVMRVQDHVGYGGDRPFFWIGGGDRPPLRGGLHVAFQAAGREEVDAFHAAALGAGGTDNGAPGLRPIYHPGYYGAYVLDPDGHNVEAVWHGG